LQLCLYQNPYLQIILQKSAVNIEQSTLAFFVPSTTKYKLSEEAKILLKTAASRNDGTILKIAFMGGKFIQAGGQSFGGGGSRESARWEYALNELLNEGLVVARGYKGEVFELTHEGWGFADELKEEK
jgi:hypothetical protein